MAEAKKLEFTQREAEIMAASFQALKSSPEYDYVKLASLLNMTNHNSAANAIRGVRKKIETYSFPDGVPLSANNAPKKRGKAAKAGKGDDANANEDNTDTKAPAAKKRTSKKKADVSATNGINGDSGAGVSDDGTAPADKSPATTTSPKRKNGSEENGSPKKKVRETKIKSEKLVKEEEGLSEDEHAAPTNGFAQESEIGETEKTNGDICEEDCDTQNEDNENVNVVKEEAKDDE